MTKKDPEKEMLPALSKKTSHASSIQPKVKREGKGKSRPHVEQIILSKYAHITDPELWRMTRDVIIFLENEALFIESAPKYSDLTYKQIGEYTIKLGEDNPVEMNVRGASSYQPETHQDDWEKTRKWENFCRIALDISYRSQDIPPDFFSLLIDISKLSGLMPLDYRWRENEQYINSKGKYEVEMGWVNGKGISSGSDTADGPDIMSPNFYMDQDNIPAFLSAVRKIKQALTEPEKFLGAGAARQISDGR